MATTTNNGWVTPDNTAYVKDGASAIRSLGQSIDTSVGTGLLAWTNYTPTISAGIGSFTSTTINTARFAVLGKLLFLDFDISINTNGTAAGSMFISVPSGRTAKNINQVGSGRELNTSGFMFQIYLDSTTNMRVLRYDNAYGLATGSRICGSLTYELA